ncbi:diphosphate--fructose-6-phosphate 1-phosphotransferase [Halalkalibacter kiskunsagensis]|uniref:Pyrophosphate--fructose 6-phosphate 1-phosphotransferase n=1 Tax=Halalkalibacter kiskunsagensis TaxID=1548599 RepID=A0ABV6KEK0_9BACI
MKKIAIGQAGGPTSVINATLVGFVKQTMSKCSLSFIRNGYDGLVHGEFIEGNDTTLQWITQHEKVPGACLGSGRYPLSDEEIEKAVRILREKRIDALVFIGGNGTMEALYKVGVEANRQGYDLQVIGLPKTVDNDLGCTDHAPGFGSAAKYVAQTTRDMSRDLHAMQNFEQVRILETMGRNAGWLAAASGFLKTYEEEGPHFIALPERQMNHEKLLQSVETALYRYGFAIVVVSEGVLWNQGAQVERDVVGGRSVLGGISKEIELYLKQELNIMARSELLGMNQRSYSLAVSSVDQSEAYFVGVTGADWIKEGRSGLMVAIERTKGLAYSIHLKPVALGAVVRAGERVMPDQFIDNLKSYYEWLEPIIGDHVSPYPPLFQMRDVKSS